MRRMKFRATPNIGGGGGFPRANQSRNKPDSGSANTSSAGTTRAVIGDSLVRSTISEASQSNSGSVPEITLDNIGQEVVPVVTVPDSPKRKLSEKVSIANSPSRESSGEVITSDVHSKKLWGEIAVIGSGLQRTQSPPSKEQEVIPIVTVPNSPSRKSSEEVAVLPSGSVGIHQTQSPASKKEEVVPIVTGPSSPSRKSSEEVAVPNFASRKSSGEVTVLDSVSRKSPEIMTVPSLSSRKSPEIMTVPSLSSRKSPEIMTVPSLSSRKSPEIRTVPSLSSRKSPEIMTVPSLSSRKSPEIRTVPSLSSRRSSGQETVPDLVSRKSSGEETVPDLVSRKSSGEETVPDLATKGKSSGEVTVLDLESKESSGEVTVLDLPSRKLTGEVTVPNVPSRKLSGNATLPNIPRRRKIAAQVIVPSSHSRKSELTSRKSELSVPNSVSRNSSLVTPNSKLSEKVTVTNASSTKVSGEVADSDSSVLHEPQSPVLKAPQDEVKCIDSSAPTVKGIKCDDSGAPTVKGIKCDDSGAPTVKGIKCDDSGGNKENAVKRSGEGKVARKDRTVNDTIKPLVQSKSKSKLFHVDMQMNRFLHKSKGKQKFCKEEEESEEDKQKKIFREKKEKFRKKFCQSQGNIERGEMTMFDLIFWNPANNPMPGRPEDSKKKDNASNGSGVDGATADILEEQMVDDLGLDGKSVVGESQPNSPSSVKEVEVCGEVSSPKVKEDSTEPDEEEARDIFAPQVKIGPNGQIILDEQSIKIQTTAAKNRDEILSKAEVVEESSDSAHYGKWSKKRRRSCEWTVKETARFYKALSTVGTDFSLMETLFSWRSRAELKTKFKKEERTNRDLVDRALKDCTQFDFTPFDDESDYDPEEDRKAARLAERAEAKRKRLELKQSQKREEKLTKKSSLKREEKLAQKLLLKEKKRQIKEHKAMLRKMRDKLKPKKRKAKAPVKTKEAADDESVVLDLNDSDAEFVVSSKSIQKEIQKNLATVKSPRKRRIKKKEPVKKENPPSPLEIREVIVTMEMVKVDPPSETGRERTICEDSSEISTHTGTEVVQNDQSVSTSAEALATQQIPQCEDISELPPSSQGNDSNDFIVTSVIPADLQVTKEDSNLVEEILGMEDQREDDRGPVGHSAFTVSSGSSQEITKDRNLADEIMEDRSVKEILGIEDHRDVDRGSVGHSKFSVTSQPPEEDKKDSNLAGAAGSMWEVPLSAIKVGEDGTRSVSIPTQTGEKLVPVPHLPPGTSSIMVVASKSPDNPNEYIYHVYCVSPAAS